MQHAVGYYYSCLLAAIVFDEPLLQMLPLDTLAGRSSERSLAVPGTRPSARRPRIQPAQRPPSSLSTRGANRCRLSSLKPCPGDELPATQFHLSRRFRTACCWRGMIGSLRSRASVHIASPRSEGRPFLRAVRTTSRGTRGPRGNRGSGPKHTVSAE